MKSYEAVTQQLQRLRHRRRLAIRHRDILLSIRLRKQESALLRRLRTQNFPEVLVHSSYQKPLF